MLRRGCRGNKLLPRTVRHLLLCIGRAAGRQVASLDTTLCLGGAEGQQATTSDSTHLLLCIGRAAGRQVASIPWTLHCV